MAIILFLIEQNPHKIPCPFVRNTTETANYGGFCFFFLCRFIAVLLGKAML